MGVGFDFRAGLGFVVEVGAASDFGCGSEVRGGFFLPNLSFSPEALEGVAGGWASWGSDFGA